MTSALSRLRWLTFLLAAILLFSAGLPIRQECRA